jgi:hypothetical protein
MTGIRRWGCASTRGSGQVVPRLGRDIEKAAVSTGCLRGRA